MSTSYTHFDAVEAEEREEAHPARPEPSSAAPFSYPETLGSFGFRFRWLRVCVIRAAERILPGFVFRAALSPILFARTLRELPRDLAARRRLARYRDPINKAARLGRLFVSRYRSNATDLVRHFPDRLGEPRWQKRLRLVGEEHLHAAFASGRPVILITLHYGAVLEMYHWLRGWGLPLVGMTVSHLDTSDLVRERLAFLADHANGLAGLPRVFGTSMDDLVNIRQFLEVPGRALAMAIDGGRGFHPATVHAKGVAVDVQLGGFTIATVTNAVVIPTLAWSGPAMTCEIRFRPPVPDELVVHRLGRVKAAEHVVRELMPLVCERPEFADGYHLLK